MIGILPRSVGGSGKVSKLPRPPLPRRVPSPRQFDEWPAECGGLLHCMPPKAPQNSPRVVACLANAVTPPPSARPVESCRCTRAAADRHLPPPLRQLPGLGRKAPTLPCSDVAQLQRRRPLTAGRLRDVVEQKRPVTAPVKLSWPSSAGRTSASRARPRCCCRAAKSFVTQGLRESCRAASHPHLWR